MKDELSETKLVSVKLHERIDTNNIIKVRDIIDFQSINDMKLDVFDFNVFHSNEFITLPLRFR